MVDLYVAAAAMIVVSVVIGGATRLVAVRLPPNGRAAGILIVVVVLLLFLWKGRGQLLLAEWIPHSAVVLWGEWGIPLIAVLIGFFASMLKVPRWRRAITCLVLVACGLYPIYEVFSRQPPLCAQSWQDGVCMQTSKATCGPAAAATLLAQANIPASEQELARLSLTSEKGSTRLGIFRGLKLKTAGTMWETEVAERRLDDLVETDQWPVLLRVELKAEADDPRYQREYGWTPGVGHVVVVLARRPDGRFLVADPSIGLETWDREALEVLWHGDALRLAPREHALAEAGLLRASAASNR